jgi:hypothetical protein
MIFEVWASDCAVHLGSMPLIDADSNRISKENDDPSAVAAKLCNRVMPVEDESFKRMRDKLAGYILHVNHN